MVLDRKEFADYWLGRIGKYTTSLGPLWEAEHGLDKKCEIFVKISPIIDSIDYRQLYYAWVDENMVGEARCFSSSNDPPEEWWGFQHKDDLVIWLLKWTNNERN